MEKTSKKKGSGIRLDKYLQSRYPRLSNRMIEQAIEFELVKHPGGTKLKKGIKVDFEPTCDLLDKKIEELDQGNPDIQGVEVLYEDKDFTVIDKPQGVPSNPLGLFDDETVTNWALAKYPNLIKEFKDELQPTLCPHRLDKDTSGLLIVCLTKKSYEKWRKTFSSKMIVKRYLAWCWGTPSKESWTNNYAIAHDLSDKSKMVAVVRKTQKHRKPMFPAHTEFKVVKKRIDRFLVEAIMKTGVTHQVRVHLASNGFPLLGDGKYDEHFELRSEKPEGHLLRAFEIKEIKKGTEQVFCAFTKDFENLY